MPTIPGQAQPISLDVGGAPDMRTTSAAPVVAALGNTISSISQDLYKSEAVDAASKQTIKDRFESQDYMTQLKMNYPTGVVTDDKGEQVKIADGSRFKTITDQYKEWSEAKYRSSQDAMDGGLGQGIYREKANELFYSDLEKVKNTELGLKTETFTVGQKQMLNQAMSRQVDSPDPEIARKTQTDLLESLAAQRKNLRLDPSEYEAQRQSILKSIPNSVLMGYEAQIRSYPNKTAPGKKSRLDILDGAISLLKGNDPNHTNFFNTMTPEDKAHWLDKFENMKLTAGKMDTSDWARRVEETKKQAMSPEGVTSTQIQTLLAEADAYHKNGNLSDQAFFDKTSNLVTLKTAYPVLNSDAFKLASPEQKQVMGDKLVQDSFSAMMSQMTPEQQATMRQAGFPAREMIRDIVKRKSESLDKLAKHDPVQFAQTDKFVKTATANLDFSKPLQLESPVVADMFKNRNQQLDNISTQYSGKPTATYLSKPEVESFAKVLEGTDLNHSTPTDVQRMLKATLQADPAKYAAVIHQVIEAKKLDSSWNMALLYSNPKLAPLTDEMVEAIRDKGKFADSAAGLLKVQAIPTSIEEVKGKIELAGQSYFSNLIGKPNSPLTKDEHNAVINTMFTMVMKKVTNGTSPDDAVKEVNTQFLGAKFKQDLEVGSGFFGKKQIVAPVYSNGVELHGPDYENLGTNLSAVQSVISHPEFIPDVPLGHTQEQADNWPKFLENSKNTRFLYNDRKNVYNMQWYDSANGSWNFLLRKGHPMEMPVDNLIIRRDANQSDFIKGVEKVKHFFKGLF